MAQVSIKPLFTIVTCTYNMGETLLDAIDSVKKQDFKDYEYFILDDGSCDNTKKILKNIRDKKIKIIRHEKRQGLTHCRNEILALASGKYLSILDADDIWSANKLSAHYEIFKKNKKCGVVWGRSFCIHHQKDKTDFKVVPPFDYTFYWDIAQDYEVVHSATSWLITALKEVSGYEKKWELVEAVHLFLKVGDSYSQVFSKDWACIQRVNLLGCLRKQVCHKKDRLSVDLMQETLKRRFNRLLSQFNASKILKSLGGDEEEEKNARR